MAKLVLTLCLVFLALSARAAIGDEKFSDAKVSFKIANHVSASIQVKIFHNGTHYRDLYISPYYFTELTEVPEGNYTLEVYDVSDVFLGYIEESKSKSAYDNGSSLISISRFGLKPTITTKLSYPDIADLAERIDLNKLAAQSIVKKVEAASPVKAPVQLAIESSVSRRLKLANLTNYLLYIEIQSPIAENLVSPRFLANDAYSPETVKEADSIIVFPADTVVVLKAFKSSEAEARECLSMTNCDRVLKTFETKISELKIDDSDSYIWIIDELP